ncbi:MAG: hypothetical protein WC332_02015 [Clostridia bacterium]
MAEKIIVSIVTLLIILCLFAYFVDVLAVISKNMEFHDICRGYMHLAEQNSGLNYEHKLRMTQDLISRGFDDIVIEAPESAIYGSQFNLKINASYSINMVNEFLMMGIQEFIMHFNQNIVARRIR